MAFHIITKTCPYCNKSFQGMAYDTYCSLPCRFWSKVKITTSNECWEWQGFKKHGYGKFEMDGKIHQAHRIAYLLQDNHIPKGLFVCHHCDNRSCMNPEHLFLGTRQDNIDDCVNKNRHHHGETHTNAKLSTLDIADIREFLNIGIKPKVLAQFYHVGRPHIYNIKNFRKRQHG